MLKEVVLSSILILATDNLWLSLKFVWMGDFLMTFVRSRVLVYLDCVYVVIAFFFLCKLYCKVVFINLFEF